MNFFIISSPTEDDLTVDLILQDTYLNLDILKNPIDPNVDPDDLEIEWEQNFKPSTENIAKFSDYEEAHYLIKSLGIQDISQVIE